MTSVFYEDKGEGGGLGPLGWESGKAGLERNLLTWILDAQSAVLGPAALASLGACWKCRIRLHFYEILRVIICALECMKHVLEDLI